MVLLFCLLAAVPAFAQGLTARFYPQKSVYLLGEPIWFVFEVTNRGRTPVRIEYSTPYGVCAFLFGYSFDVPGAMTVGGWRCGYVGDCAGRRPILLAPGATYSQRLLLNQWFVIDHPGRYRISASRQLRFGVRTDRFHLLLAPRSLTFKSQFEVDVVEGERAKVENALEPFLKNLSSHDFDRRIEAVETITAVAPQVLERTIIALANSGDSFARSRAIPALGQLNTPESRRVLAKLIEDREADYSWQAIDALAQTLDRTYVPLLEELARDPAWQNAAVPALGELGGQAVVSFLAPLVHSPHGPLNELSMQQLAISGLANTGSREAIPYLIEALRDPFVHHDAVTALEQLTHLVIHEGTSQRWLFAEDPKTAAKMAKRWQRWWKSAGKNAKLYALGDCTSSPGQLPE